MTHLSRAFVLALSMFFAVGCAKTEGQKTEDAKAAADTAIKQFETSARAMDAMGTPSPTWSDAEFATYEGHLGSCEANLNRIDGANGKDNIIIYGISSVPKLRELLGQARTKMNEARAAKTAAGVPVTGTQPMTDEAKKARAKHLVELLRQNNEQMEAKPLKFDSSDADYDAFDALAARSETAARELETLMTDENGRRVVAKMIEAYVEQRKSIAEIREERKKLTTETEEKST